MPSPFTAELIVEDYLSGVRVDSFLLKHFRNYTPFRMQRMVGAGQVKVNGERVEISQRVFRGQHVLVRLIEPPDKLLEPEPLPLDILFEDDWLILVNKPAGQAVHPVANYQTGTLVNAVQHHLDQRSALPGLLRPGIVHRLDRLTSGVMVIAKDHLSHRRLSIQFQQHDVAKSYLVLVDGCVVKQSGTIELPIGMTPESGSILMSAGADAITPKPALTLFEVVTRFRRHSLVLAKPASGRLHQIRVHFAAIGHPVVGDEFYGADGRIMKSAENADRSLQETLIHRHALHAYRLEFSHPITQEQLRFEAPMPHDIRTAIKQIERGGMGGLPALASAGRP